MEVSETTVKPTRFQRLLEEQRAVRTEIKDRMLGSITGAIGLIAGLAWNDAVKSLIEFIYPPGEGITSKFLYATIITVVAAFFIYLISKWLTEKK